MPQEAASSGLVDPDSRPPPPPPSSPPPAQQLSPEALRELVLACGSEAEGGNEASSPTRDRLRGQLGFCFDPMPWDLAAAAVADGGVTAMGRMGRTPEGVARYWRWRDEVCAGEYASTADYVRIEIMGCEAAVAGGESRGEVVGGGGGVGVAFFFRFVSGGVFFRSFFLTYLALAPWLSLSLSRQPKKNKNERREKGRGGSPRRRGLEDHLEGKRARFLFFLFLFSFFPSSDFSSSSSPFFLPLLFSVLSQGPLRLLPPPPASHPLPHSHSHDRTSPTTSRRAWSISTSGPSRPWRPRGSSSSSRRGGRAPTSRRCGT